MGDFECVDGTDDYAVKIEVGSTPDEVDELRTKK